MLANAEAVVPVAPMIPWYFVPLVVIIALSAVAMVVKGIATLLAAYRTHKLRASGKATTERVPARGTFTALALGCAVAALLGFNYQSVWYVLNPALTSPEENIDTARAQLSDAGATDITLRDTEPRHSLERVDIEAWEADQPLTFLLACDQGQLAEAGQFPPYDRHEWELPISYVDNDSGEQRPAVIHRTVADDECTFTLDDIEAEEAA